MNAEIERVYFRGMVCLPISNAEKRHMGPQHPLSTEYSIVYGYIRAVIGTIFYNMFQ